MDLFTRSKKQHVVAVPIPGQGHLNAMMRFCHLLASHGILVTCVNIEHVHHRIEEVRQQRQADEQSPTQLQKDVALTNIRFAHIPVHDLDIANIHDLRVSFESFGEAMRGIAPQLERLILQLNQQGPTVTSIVSDVNITIPTQIVADKLNIRRTMLSPYSASMLLLHVYVVQGEHTSLTKVLEALSRRAERKEVICEGLEGLPILYNNEVPYYKHLADESPYLWRAIEEDCRVAFGHSHAIALNSFEDLEAEAFMALRKHLSLPVYGVGPLLEPPVKGSAIILRKEDGACMLWLDKQPPLSVLYVSFGSITLLSRPQFEEMVAGLLSSQQRFLWVFRSDLVENVENCGIFVADVVARSDGRGFVVDWAPQLQVLSHPSVGGFLTHCGWNSTTEAMVQGVPMLCWPYIADQFLNAKFVAEEWKVGLHLRGSKEGSVVERGEVERVVRALMEGEEGRCLRKNVGRLREAASRSVQAGGTHVDLEALIASLM